ERLAVVTLAPAHVARHVHVRQEVHLHADHAVSLAGLAAPAADVEAEAARVVAAGARFRHGREQLAQRREQPRVGRGVRARRAPDRALVDVDDPIDLLEPLDSVAGRRLDARALQTRGGVAEQRVDDQRRLPGARDSGDAREEAERDVDADARQVIAVGAEDLDLARRVRSGPQARDLDAPLAREILPGDRGRARGDLARRALRHEVPAVGAGAGSQVDDVIRLTDRLLVVLDHDHRVAEVAELLERCEQPAVVALVQPDRGLVQDVHDPGEPRPYLAREPDALRFPAGERLGVAIERQVVEAHVGKEAQPLDDAPDDPRGHLATPAGEIQRTEKLERAADRESGKLRERPVGDEHVPRRAAQARSLALRARPHAEVPRQLLAHHLGSVLAIAPGQLRADLFAWVAPAGRRFGARGGTR